MQTADDQAICVATRSVNLFRVLDTEEKCSNAKISKILLFMIHVEKTAVSAERVFTSKRIKTSTTLRNLW